MASSKQEYQGKSLSVVFDGSKCIHARRCVTGKPNVFIANANGPWIKPDNSDPESLAALIQSCPSGALSWKSTHFRSEEKPQRNTIRVAENGPLCVTADYELSGEQGIRTTLCRCGHSKNKPYCDGSHTAADFVATGEPATAETMGDAPGMEVLKIQPMPNGPLIVQGALEMQAGSGRCISRGEKHALCRCGQSKNKPYCDGSHVGAGFQAE